MNTEPFVTSLVIDAPPDVVFDCFCDPRALITWMGDAAEVEPHPGGIFSVDINGVLVRGHYEVVDRPHRVVLTWGTLGSTELPPDSSTVEVTLVPQGSGTLVTLVHSGLPGDQLDVHRAGWAHFLSRLRVAAIGADPGPDPWRSNPSQPSAPS